MIHGIIGVCSKTGKTLFSKKFSHAYGLPSSPESDSIDTHKLAALIFAFQLNAGACLSETAGSKSPDPVSLKFLRFGNSMKIFFHCHPDFTNLIVALFVDAQMQEKAAMDLMKVVFLHIQESLPGHLPSGSRFLSGKLQGAGEIVKSSMVQYAQDLLSQLMESMNHNKKSLSWGWASLADQELPSCPPSHMDADLPPSSRGPEDAHGMGDLTAVGVASAVRPSLEAERRSATRGSRSRASCYSMFLPKVKRKRISHPAKNTEIPTWCKGHYVWVDMQEDDLVVMDSTAKVAKPLGPRKGPSDALLRGLVETLAEGNNRVLVSGFSVKKTDSERLNRTKKRRKEVTNSQGQEEEDDEENNRVGCFLGLRSRVSKKRVEFTDSASLQPADQIVVVTLERLVVAIGIKQESNRGDKMFEDEEEAESVHGLPWLFDKVNAEKFEEQRQTSHRGKKWRSTGDEIINFERNLLLLNDFLSFLRANKIQS